MLKVARGAMVVPILLLFIFILAMMPLVLKDGAGGETFYFDWTSGFEGFKDYVIGIANGDSFLFYSGQIERSFREQVGGYFTLSFLYVGAGALIGAAIGILVGIWFAYSKSEWWKRAFEMTGIIPDFVIIILLQFAIVQIGKQTGVILFKIANFSSNEPAIMLPLISMIVIPAHYMIRGVALQMRLTLTEDYILNAKARGLSKRYILFFHALPNVLPFVKADLHKFMGILVGNLFIVEYFYNLRGVTKLLFSDAFAYQGYQYDLVVNGLVTLFVLYAALYGLLRLFIYAAERVVVR